MNPRLQVEHPVTEEVQGVDFVAALLDMARGLRMPTPTAHGHATEVRIYAEDPERSFAPAPGRITFMRVSGGPGIRFDSGFREGDEIDGRYDPMIAKLVAWGRNRREAWSRLESALSDTRIVVEGGATNIPFLRKLVSEMRERAHSVDLIDSLSFKVDEGARISSMLAATVLEYMHRSSDAIRNFSINPRLDLASPKTVRFTLENSGEHAEMTVRRLSTSLFHIESGEGQEILVHWLPSSHAGIHLGEGMLRVEEKNVPLTYEKTPGGWRITSGAWCVTWNLREQGLVRAPSPAVITALHVNPGQMVKSGELLATLEAMKLEIPVRAPVDGRVEAILVSPGRQVMAGDPVLRISPKEDVPSHPILLPEGNGTADAFEILSGALLGYDVTAGEVQRVEEATTLDPKQISWLLNLASLVTSIISPLPRFHGEDGKRLSGRALVASLMRHEDVGGIPTDFRERLERLGSLLHHGDGSPEMSNTLFRLARILTAPGIMKEAIHAILRMAEHMHDHLERSAILEESLITLASDPQGGAYQTDLALSVRWQIFDAPEYRTSPWNSLTDHPDELVRQYTSRRSVTQNPYLNSDSIPDGKPDDVQVVFMRQWSDEEFIRIAKQHDSAIMEIVLAEVPASLTDHIPSVLRGISHVRELRLTDLSSDLTWTYRHHQGGTFLLARKLSGLHPEVARRTFLRRFSLFSTQHVSSMGGLHLLKAVGLDSPEDERFIVLGDVGFTTFKPEHPDVFPELARAFRAACHILRKEQSRRPTRKRLHWNHIVLYVEAPPDAPEQAYARASKRLAVYGERLGLEEVTLVLGHDSVPRSYVTIRGRSDRTSRLGEAIMDGIIIEHGDVSDLTEPIRPLPPAMLREIKARTRGMKTPEAILNTLVRDLEGRPVGSFNPYEILLDPADGTTMSHPVDELRHTSGVVFGILKVPTPSRPEGLERTVIISDALHSMGALAEPECRRIMAALNLAESRRISVLWVPISAGARIDLDSGTENLDWTARALRRIVEFTQAGGIIDIIVDGVNVGAQSYFDAEATMLQHTRGMLVMTRTGSMVLTGKKALEASGAVSAEDNLGIGGAERIMYPTGQAQALADDLMEAHRLLLMHADLVMPSENGLNITDTRDQRERDITKHPYPASLGHGFVTLKEIFDETTNPGRKRPFSVRPVMEALRDTDAFTVERWGGMNRGAENVHTWETRIGGIPVMLLGIDAYARERSDPPPFDGPTSWSGSTLFPRGSYKIARALNAASGHIPAVILANLSGFDGSPESLREWQLIHGAEIGRAMVNFQGPILLVVLSRYHGGAYVVFSTALNDSMRAVALEGSYASVIGGSAAAAVVFGRDILQKVEMHPEVTRLRDEIKNSTNGERRRIEADLRKLREKLTSMYQKEMAERFDSIHTVQRAMDVGSISDIIPSSSLRPYVISFLESRIGSRH